MLLALALLVLVFAFVGNRDYEAARVSEQIKREVDARVAAELQSRRPRTGSAELLCDCRKAVDGRRLRLSITQQPDGKLCRARCFYDGLPKAIGGRPITIMDRRP